jgi:hypothetical protein
MLAAEDRDVLIDPADLVLSLVEPAVSSPPAPSLDEGSLFMLFFTTTDTSFVAPSIFE